jgi:uncharacterized protein (TIGR02757 family)
MTMTDTIAKRKTSTLDEFERVEVTWKEATIAEFRGLPAFFQAHFKNRRKAPDSSSVVGVVKRITKGTDYFGFFATIVNYQTNVPQVMIPMLTGLVDAIGTDFDQFLDRPAREAHDLLASFGWIFTNSKGLEIQKQGWFHRFEKIERVECLLAKLRALKQAGGFKQRVASIFHGNFKEFFESFLELLRSRETCGACQACDGSLCKKVFAKPKVTAASCLKRYLLFLRWMVRKDDIDIGLWGDIIDKKQLLIPIDIIIKRVCGRVGVVPSEEGCAWKDVVAITRFFRDLSPDDPMAYDFYVTRLGLLRFCVKDVAKCKCYACPLSTVCKAKHPEVEKP